MKKNTFLIKLGYKISHSIIFKYEFHCLLCSFLETTKDDIIKPSFSVNLTLKKSSETFYVPL